MAEGFARALGGSDVRVGSAGSDPSGVVNPDAVRVMAELGIDISGQRSGTIDEAVAALRDGEREPLDAVVSMGCGDACPHVPARERVEWDIPDPSGKSLDEFRRVRNLVRERIIALLQSP